MKGLQGSSSCAGFAARSSSQTHPKPWTACKLAALRSRNGGDTVAAPRQEAVEAPPLADGGELTLNCDLGGPTAHRDREHCSSPRCAVFSPPAPCQPARPRAQEDLHPRRRQCRRLTRTYPCVADLCRRVIVVRGCAQPQYGRNGPTALVLSPFPTCPGTPASDALESPSVGGCLVPSSSERAVAPLLVILARRCLALCSRCPAFTAQSTCGARMRTCALPTTVAVVWRTQRNSLSRVSAS